MHFVFESTLHVVSDRIQLRFEDICPEALHYLRVLTIIRAIDLQAYEDVPLHRAALRDKLSGSSLNCEAHVETLVRPQPILVGNVCDILPIK